MQIKVSSAVKTTHPDRGLSSLFEKYGLADLRQTVCDNLGVESFVDVARHVEHQDIQALTLLKPG
jgi:hypothetical protein